MDKTILSGNEAFARGAFEAGVKVASAYPGTPSTEILENIARSYPSIDSSWAPNEKVSHLRWESEPVTAGPGPW
jgi:indolepyruvate ferredoxin oxidoreductase, alpha subunit